MTPEQFRDLLQKFQRQEMTPPELESFLEAAAGGQYETLLEEDLTQGLKAATYPGVSSTERMEKVYQQFLEKKKPEKKKEKPERNGKAALIRRFRWTAAAAILLSVVMTGVFYYRHRPAPARMDETAGLQQLAPEVPPGGNKATLTLASGARITLDSAHSGELTRQGNMRVIQLDSGRLAYQPQAGASQSLEYNTITTPRGGQYRVVLADGTQVWLNAASSLQYPTAFTGNTREVILQGEAYFEVAPRADKPFIVQTGKDTRIEVLGTHFNVTNYPDEKNILTTLTQGAVRVDAGKESHLLSPGQQARATALPEGGTRLTITSDIKPEQVMAWKDGLFDFQDMPFDRVMRQLSRWYDIDVVYEDGVPDIKFEGQLGRDVNLSRILFFFQKVGVHYHMEGNRKLVISK